MLWNSGVGMLKSGYALVVHTGPEGMSKWIYSKPLLRCVACLGSHAVSYEIYVYIICVLCVEGNAIASWITFASNAFSSNPGSATSLYCTEVGGHWSRVCILLPILLLGLSYSNRLDIGEKQIWGWRGYVSYVAATWHFFIEKKTLGWTNLKMSECLVSCFKSNLTFSDV